MSQRLDIDIEAEANIIRALKHPEFKRLKDIFMAINPAEIPLLTMFSKRPFGKTFGGNKEAND